MILIFFSLTQQSQVTAKENEFTQISTDFNSILNPIVFNKPDNKSNIKIEDVLFFDCRGCNILLENQNYTSNITLNKICCYQTNYYSTNNCTGVFYNVQANSITQNLTSIVLSQGDYLSSFFANSVSGKIFNHNESYNFLKTWCSYYVDGSYVDYNLRQGYEIRYVIEYGLGSEEHGMCFRHQDHYWASYHYIVNMTTHKDTEVLFLESCGITLSWFYLLDNSPTQYLKHNNISLSNATFTNNHYDKEFNDAATTRLESSKMYVSRIMVRMCYHLPPKDCPKGFIQKLKNSFPSFLKRTLCFLFNS